MAKLLKETKREVFFDIRLTEDEVLFIADTFGAFSRSEHQKHLIFYPGSLANLRESNIDRKLFDFFAGLRDGDYTGNDRV